MFVGFLFTQESLLLYQMGNLEGCKQLSEELCNQAVKFNSPNYNVIAGKAKSVLSGAYKQERRFTKAEEVLESSTEVGNWTLLSHHVRKSKIFLDSGLHSAGSGFQALYSSLCQWNLDSGFQCLVPVGFQIPWAVFQIPTPKIPNSTSEIFPVTRDLDSITWGDFQVTLWMVTPLKSNDLKIDLKMCCFAAVRGSCSRRRDCY